MRHERPHTGEVDGHSTVRRFEEVDHGNVLVAVSCCGARDTGGRTQVKPTDTALSDIGHGGSRSERHNERKKDEGKQSESESEKQSESGKKNGNTNEKRNGKGKRKDKGSKNESGNERENERTRTRGRARVMSKDTAPYSNLKKQIIPTMPVAVVCCKA